MNDFNKFNKVTGVYWLKNTVEDIKIRIKLKPQDSLISLPKFEEYTNEANLTPHDSLQEYVFKWQEKCFCVREIQQYSDIHKCTTDTELTYHNMINNSTYTPDKIFTYIHDDYHTQLPNDIKKNNTSIFEVTSCMKMLKLNDKLDTLTRRSNSMAPLFRSEENFEVTEEQWTAMHVMLDNSKYNEDYQLLMKQEVTLVSLYHNKIHNYLILSPDVNNLEINPYIVETLLGVPLGYEYGVEVDFEERGNSEELNILLRKLLKKWEKKHMHLTSFSMPPLEKKLYYVTVDILTANGFDLDNLYIEYKIKIPESITCNGDLHGRTHSSTALRTEDAETCNFGYMIELGLEITSELEPPPLQIFFEVISADWWGRHRTEGYTYLPLTLNVGCYKKRLSCSRPEENDRVQAESRRFFIGGCHLIKDMEVLAKPQLQDANFTYTTTGSINLQWNIISQTHIPRTSQTPIPSTSTASAVLLGAEAVLRQYRKARAKLAAATRDMDRLKRDGSGDS